MTNGDRVRCVCPGKCIGSCLDLKLRPQTWSDHFTSCEVGEFWTGEGGARQNAYSAKPDSTCGLFI